MDRDKDNVWSRRSAYVCNSGSLSQTNCHRNNHQNGESSDSKKRFDSNRSNPFNNIPPIATTNIQSPTSARAGASSAFGLGSGAFGFGSAKNTPKTPASAFEFPPTSSSSSTTTTITTNNKKDGDTQLKHSWIVWYRPPSSKNSDYEKSIKPLCRMASVIEFWKVYVHLKRPSMLPVVSDYHFFKQGIRPVWEDEENKRGGKWILRLKKGVADRYWEQLLMAMVGNQFAEASDEVCGAVLSVRSGEDVLSIWTKNDGGRNIKIRYGFLVSNFVVTY
jgi:translation initiation factor 4E